MSGHQSYWVPQTSDLTPRDSDCVALGCPLGIWISKIPPWCGCCKPLVFREVTQFSSSSTPYQTVVMCDFFLYPQSPWQFSNTVCAHTHTAVLGRATPKLPSVHLQRQVKDKWAHVLLGNARQLAAEERVKSLGCLSWFSLCRTRAFASISTCHG